MLASVELKKRENLDDIDFLQMNGYVPCGIISIWVYFCYQKQVSRGGSSGGGPGGPGGEASGGFRGGRAGRAPPLKFTKQILYNVN
jgi:hypothetical protein